MVSPRVTVFPKPLLWTIVATLILLGMGVVLLTTLRHRELSLRSDTQVNEAELLELGKVSPYAFPVLPNSRNVDSEIAFYEKTVEKNPKSSLEQVALAGAYLKKARLTHDPAWYERAENTARRSLANMSVSNRGAKFILADVAQARHRFPESIRLAEEILKENPNNVDALAVLVTANLGLGNIAEADRQGEILVRQVPTLVPLTLRAVVKWSQGKEKDALMDFQRASQVEDIGEVESSAWMRTLLARLHLNRGRYEMARGLLQETLRFRPDYPLSLGLLAEVEMKSGNYDLAEQHYNRAFQVSGDLIFQVHLAHLKDLRGEKIAAAQLRDETEAKIRETLKGPYGHASDLGDLLLDRGKPKDIAEAISIFEQEATKRQDSETLNKLAKALAMGQRWEEARQVISQALRYGIQDADIFYQAALIEKGLNHPEKAAQYLRQTLEINPAFKG